MLPPRDPASMSPADRRAELGDLLAGAYLRLLATGEERRDSLAEAGEPEAACAPVDGAESAPGKEHAWK